MLGTKSNHIKVVSKELKDTTLNFNDNWSQVKV